MEMRPIQFYAIKIMNANYQTELMTSMFYVSGASIDILQNKTITKCAFPQNLDQLKENWFYFSVPFEYNWHLKHKNIYEWNMN